MQSIIESYGINFQEFRELLCEYIALVSGSTALHGYLVQEGIVPNFQPNNLDIFVYPYINVTCACTDCLVRKYGKNKHEATTIFHLFLIKYGFTLTNLVDISNDMDDRHINDAQNIMYYSNGNKTIKLICVKYTNILDYISTVSDISICATWWDDKYNRFVTLNRDRVLRGQMYPLIEKLNSERVTKYIQRGFTITDKPCIHKHFKDPRTPSVTLKNINAFDIFTYDDVNASEYLQLSDWNILVKCCDKFYAFHRNTLVTYLNSKLVYANKSLGNVADTPFHQSICEQFIKEFLYADYSVYELKYKYSIIIDNGVKKSIYSLDCYLLSDWEQNTVTYSCCPADYKINPNTLSLQLEGLNIDPIEDLMDEDYDY
jgi:hypothetical protein